MAWTSPRTWVSGEVITAALLNTHLRDNQLEMNGTASAWSTWVPTISGISMTTNRAAYKQIGKTVHVNFKGTASTAPSGGINVTLPVAPNAADSSAGVAVAVIGSVIYVGSVMPFAGGSGQTQFVSNADGFIWGVGGGHPATWAAGSTLQFSVTYEAA